MVILISYYVYIYFSIQNTAIEILKKTISGLGRGGPLAGTDQSGQPGAEPRSRRWRNPLRKSWEKDVKFIGEIMGTYGQLWEDTRKLLENYGKIMVSYWKHRGNIWKTTGILWEDTL